MNAKLQLYYFLFVWMLIWNPSMDRSKSWTLIFFSSYYELFIYWKFFFNLILSRLVRIFSPSFMIWVMISSTTLFMVFTFRSLGDVYSDLKSEVYCFLLESGLDNSPGWGLSRSQMGSMIAFMCFAFTHISIFYSLLFSLSNCSNL